MLLSPATGWSPDMDIFHLSQVIVFYSEKTKVSLIKNMYEPSLELISLQLGHFYYCLAKIL